MKCGHWLTQSHYLYLSKAVFGLQLSCPLNVTLASGCKAHEGQMTNILKDLQLPTIKRLLQLSMKLPNMLWTWPCAVTAHVLTVNASTMHQHGCCTETCFYTFGSLSNKMKRVDRQWCFGKYQRFNPVSKPNWVHPISVVINASASRSSMQYLFWVWSHVLSIVCEQSQFAEVSTSVFPTNALTTHHVTPQLQRLM